MSVLVVGSMAIDTVHTPFGKAEDVLGGSASYFSIAASLFSDVRVVAVIGDDFPDKYLENFESRSIELNGLKKVKGKTFRWEGRYGYDLGDPETLGTYLNVFEDFNPEIPDEYKDTDYVFLGNIDPELQLHVLNQVKDPKLVACDTMNFWIENKLDNLLEVVSKVDVLLINDSECRELAGEAGILKAARKVVDMGPKILIVKRGEYGALMFSDQGIFWAPSYPLEDVVDPTGAGDTFAGGFMGYISGNGIKDYSGYKKAIVYGSVLASFTVEDFSVGKIISIRKPDIETRYEAFLRLSNFE